MARLRAMTRFPTATEEILECDGVRLHLNTRKLERDGVGPQLGSREFALLEYFMRNQNRVVSRDQIGENVWDINFEPSSNVVDVYVSSLRRKLEQITPTKLIHTVKNVGYRFGVME